MGPAKNGAPRVCPHCQGSFVITADKKLAFITALSAAIIGFFVLRPIPVIGGPLWGFVAVVATILVAARLKKFDQTA